MSKVIKSYSRTGICVVDVEYLIKKWNHLYWIAQWENTYRLIKMVRKDSPMSQVKVTISEEQAKELIKILGLEPNSSLFKSATTWKKPNNTKHI